jgi:general stress protein YciG
MTTMMTTGLSHSLFASDSLSYAEIARSGGHHVTESDSDDSDDDHGESDSNGNIEEQPATAAAATPTLTTAAE